MGSGLQVFSPLEDGTDTFSENVSVIIQDLRGRIINIQIYKEISERQLVESKIIESKIINIENNKYYKAVYDSKQEKYKLRFTCFCFIKKEISYVVTLTTEVAKYGKFKRVGENILNSFALTE